MTPIQETQLSPDELDMKRREASISDLVEQGGLDPLADTPFQPQLAEHLTDDERAKLALAHDYRDARKLEYVINRGDLTPADVAGTDALGVKKMIKQHFDADYKLPLKHPSEAEPVEEKTEGHYAEDALVKIFNESGLQVHAELGSDYLDAIGKADIVLFIRVAPEKEVVLKVQAKVRAKQKDIEDLPSNALLVELASIPLPEPDEKGRRTYSNEKVIDLAARGNQGDKRNFTTKYFSRVLEALQHTPRNVYTEAKEALSLV